MYEDKHNIEFQRAEMMKGSQFMEMKSVTVEKIR